MGTKTLENTDQLISEDIELFSTQIASIYTNLLKPIVDLVIFTIKLAVSMEITGILFDFLCFTYWFLLSFFFFFFFFFNQALLECMLILALLLLFLLLFFLLMRSSMLSCRRRREDLENMRRGSSTTRLCLFIIYFIFLGYSFIPSLTHPVLFFPFFFLPFSEMVAFMGGEVPEKKILNSAYESIFSQVMYVARRKLFADVIM